MKYIMILLYFYMVLLCNIKISAHSVRQQSKQHYDIDGFISQLLASRKFDELAEKMAEKAANKIMHNDAEYAPIQRATEDKEVENLTESTQIIHKNQSKKFENTQSNNVKLSKDFTGKINPQAVINATISLSENLQLKYKYLKKNALEKREKIVPKIDTKKDPQTTGPADFEDRNNKTEEPMSNQNATAKNQNDTKIEPFDENERSRDETKDDVRQENPIINSELNESSHSSTDYDMNDSSKEHHSQEEQGPTQEQKKISEAQNSGSENKSIVVQEVSQVKNEIKEDKLSSIDEDNQKYLTRSENIIAEVETTEGEPEKRGTGEINVQENVIPQFRASQDSSIEENKVSSDNKPHVLGVFRTRASDDSADNVRSKEQSLEDQTSKEQSSESQSSKEESSENQSSKEESGEDPSSSKFKPEIRTEGDKQYTYVKAPEYEEYYEKLAKLRPQNPADFMK